MLITSQINPNENYPLKASGTWPDAKHQFEERDIYAIETAIASGRPLLVRGEPGTGKSQLARAAAKALKRYFVYEVISAKTESEDLLWSFDAISRLGEAQKLGAAGQDNTTVEEALKAEKFLSPGAVWWALNWKSADTQLNGKGKCKHRKTVQVDFKNKQDTKQGAVLLIDEIDKGDADFANGLLETMGNLSFSVPWLEECDAVIRLTKNAPKPLVIITTNEERELPPAFVRRCMVLDLELPDDDKLAAWLCKRGEIQYGDKTNDAVRKKAAEQLLRDRKEAQDKSVSPPGQAEYLDILRAVSELSADYAQQEKILDKISQFALKKYPEER